MKSLIPVWGLRLPEPQHGQVRACAANNSRACVQSHQITIERTDCDLCARDIIHVNMSSPGIRRSPVLTTAESSLRTFEFDPASGITEGFNSNSRTTWRYSALITHPGEVVLRRSRLACGRDQFRNFEHGVNAAVNKLRQVLGDAATEARYRNAGGRGYRFAPISSAGGST